MWTFPAFNPFISPQFPPHPVVFVFTATMSFLTGQSNTIQEQRDRWERKRSRTAKELVKTEQQYCQQLALVTTVSTV